MCYKLLLNISPPSIYWGLVHAQPPEPWWVHCMYRVYQEQLQKEEKYPLSCARGKGFNDVRGQRSDWAGETKARPPYAAEGPWRWRLFNMPSQSHRGPQETNTSFPPTRPTCPPDERGLEEVRREKSASGGWKEIMMMSPIFLPAPPPPPPRHLCATASVLRPSASVPGRTLLAHGTIRFVISCECSDRTMSHSCIQNRLHLLKKTLSKKNKKNTSSLSFIYSTPPPATPCADKICMSGRSV